MISTLITTISAFKIDNKTNFLSTK